MRVEELRIGNYYQWYADSKYYYFKVDNAFFMDINTINNAEPIPLTEEILLKCGFVNIESKNIYKLYLPNDNQLLIGFNFQSELRLYYKVFNVDLVEIKSLHQLQNLYFALTGKELEFKK